MVYLQTSRWRCKSGGGAEQSAHMKVLTSSFLESGLCFHAAAAAGLHCRDTQTSSFLTNKGSDFSWPLFSVDSWNVLMLCPIPAQALLTFREEHRP